MPEFARFLGFFVRSAARVTAPHQQRSTQLQSCTPADRRIRRGVGAAYEQHRQDAIAADMFGSPAYVLDGEIFWGQDRLELLADALKSGRSAYTCQT